MIPLNLKFSGDVGQSPFVVRLTRGLASDPRDAPLTNEYDAVSDFKSYRGHIKVLGAKACDLIGDVLLVNPRRQTAYRLIRSHSAHNTLLVTEQCDQLCLMCSQPPKEHHHDLFPFFKEAVELAPDGSTIGISGGEPLLHKNALRSLIEHGQTQRPDINFHILTNAQHFQEADRSWLSASSKVLWGVPIYSSDSQLHDEIVGKEGAFANVRKSLALLARSGSQIELRTVVMTPNAGNLEALSDFICRSIPHINFWAIMQLERIGFGKLKWKELFFDSGLDFTPIGAALDVMTARGMRVCLYNFPLCTIPQAYRQLAVASISDWKRKYMECCNTCSCKNSCGGFFEWYNSKWGFTGVARL